MSRHKDDADFNDPSDDDTNDQVDSKTKREIRIEKHGRLMDYFEEKRLREDLDFIDNYPD